MQSLERFRELATRNGAKPPHLRLLVRTWLAGLPLEHATRNRAFELPDPVRRVLPELEALLGAILEVAAAHRGDDGSQRLVGTLHDGLTLETVLLRRQTVCVSTQIGCRVGCVFCKTGEDGLLRHLTADEILAQVTHARRRQEISRVVFMGMGEPSHNLEAVLAAMQRLGNEGRIGHKNLVFSTVGSRSAIERLLQSETKPALAISLHTTSLAKRTELLPRAPRIEPRELIELADRYGRLVGHPIQYQWTLLAGVNDSPEEFAELADLMVGKSAIVNLIPYNTVDGLPFERPEWEHGVELVRLLRRRGVVATVRRSGGQDVDAACGQLRVRFEAARS